MNKVSGHLLSKELQHSAAEVQAKAKPFDTKEQRKQRNLGGFKFWKFWQFWQFWHFWQLWQFVRGSL